MAKEDRWFNIKRKARRKKDKWIQRAIKHPGALKQWLRKRHPELLKRNREISFTKLRQFYRKNKDKLTTHRRRQIQLALNLHKLKRRKK